jgi:hypothetical protein
VTLKDQAASINRRLSNISKKKNVAFTFVMTEFLIERLLARLVADSELKNLLVFKGGFVALKQYESPRYTIDLDALARRNPGTALERLIDSAISQRLEDAVWFRRESTIDLATQGEYGGIRFSLRAGIGEVLKNLKRAQILNSILVLAIRLRQDL